MYYNRLVHKSFKFGFYPFIYLCSTHVSDFTSYSKDLEELNKVLVNCFYCFDRI